MKFKYRARTIEGKIKIGEVEAFSREAAINILQRYGLYPIFLEEVTPKVPLWELPFFKRIGLKDLVIAFRELAIMFKSGVSIVEALNTIARENKNKKLKEVFFEMAKEVEGGQTLSEAMSHWPHVFQKTYIALVKTGEAAGELPKTLETLADSLEKNYHLRGRIKAALWYPTLVFCVSIVVFLFIIFSVLPKLASFASAMGANLPSLAKNLLNLNKFLKSWWLPLLILSCGSLSSLILFLKTPEGKNIFDKLSLKFPILGEFLKIMTLVRISEGLSTLISSGVPLSQSLEIMEETIGNVYYQTAISEAKNAVRVGEPLSRAFQKHPEYFPDFLSEMISVGEKTGTLTRVFLNISSFYEKELQRKIDALTEILTPFLIVILALVVGFLMFTVLTTIYSVLITIM